MTTFEQDLASARHTVDKEIEALRLMEDSLDDSLTRALDILQNIKGRVIISTTAKILRRNARSAAFPRRNSVFSKSLLPRTKAPVSPRRPV